MVKCAHINCDRTAMKDSKWCEPCRMWHIDIKIRNPIKSEICNQCGKD